MKLLAIILAPPIAFILLCAIYYWWAYVPREFTVTRKDRDDD